MKEEDGQISTCEFNWNPAAKYKYSHQFVDAYPGNTFQVISRANIEDFLLDL